MIFKTKNNTLTLEDLRILLIILEEFCEKRKEKFLFPVSYFIETKENLSKALNDTIDILHAYGNHIVTDHIKLKDLFVFHSVLRWFLLEHTGQETEQAKELLLKISIVLNNREMKI